MICRITWVWLLIAAVAVGHTGCGGGPEYPVGTVKGTLLLKGKTVPEPLDIFFMDHQSGFAYQARVGHDGSFAVEEPVRVGEYVAYVQPAVDLNLDMSAPPQGVSMSRTVPRKYSNDAQSDLKASVEEGENTFEFDMK